MSLDKQLGFYLNEYLRSTQGVSLLFPNAGKKHNQNLLAT